MRDATSRHILDTAGFASKLLLQSCVPLDSLPLLLFDQLGYPLGAPVSIVELDFAITYLVHLVADILLQIALDVAQEGYVADGGGDEENK